MSKKDFLVFFQDGYELDTEIGKIVFTPFVMGNLVINSGYLWAADALIRISEELFQEQLPLGSYPTYLSIAHIKKNNRQRVAYAMITVSDKIPIKWQLAIRQGRKLE